MHARVKSFCRDSYEVYYSKYWWTLERRLGKIHIRDVPLLCERNARYLMSFDEAVDLVKRIVERGAQAMTQFERDQIEEYDRRYAEVCRKTREAESKTFSL